MFGAELCSTDLKEKSPPFFFLLLKFVSHWKRLLLPGAISICRALGSRIFKLGLSIEEVHLCIQIAPEVAFGL